MEQGDTKFKMNFLNLNECHLLNAPFWIDIAASIVLRYNFMVTTPLWCSLHAYILFYLNIPIYLIHTYLLRYIIRNMCVSFLQTLPSYTLPIHILNSSTSYAILHIIYVNNSVIWVLMARKIWITVHTI